MTILQPLRIAFMVCVTTALALAAGPAFAHAELLSELPVAADDADAAAAIAPVTELRLSFSESLNVAFSKVEVIGAAGQVAAGSVALDAADNKVLVVTLAAPLAAGGYTVNWTAVSDDGHKVTGTYTLNIK
jgi:methionine-rich copper-binding protein CopC